MISRRWKTRLPQLITRPEGHRIVSKVGGHSFFIESSHPLMASAESIVSAFFLPAMRAGARIAYEGEIDATFYANTKKIGKIASDWWGWPADEGRIEVGQTKRGNPRSGSSAMFFTGGVDSFCTLRRNLGEVEALIYVHGFDIKLTDSQRFEKARGILEKVADDLEMQLILVATDLRSNRRFNLISWTISHVSALAAIAHGLQENFGRVLIASSDVLPPWGSHPDFDPLFSSSTLEIVNDGASLSRLDKVKFIADWAPVHRHLKVCWENLSSELNCGICEKCVRTQAQFAAANSLHLLDVFPEGKLSDRIEGLPWVAGELQKQWLEIRHSLEEAELSEAIDRLLSRRAPMVPTYILKRLIRWFSRVRTARSAPPRARSM